MARRRGKKRDERVLLLWNQVGKDEFETLAEAGPQALAWDPSRNATEVTTVKEEIDAIAEALAGAGFGTRSVNIADDLDTLIAAIRKYKPDVVFNLVEFFNDQATQEAYVAGLYEMLGVPYTGAGPLALMTCQRKFRTKVLLESQGVPTPAFRRFDELPVSRDLGIKYPVIVKPAREDASGGIHADAVVNDHEALVERVRRVLEDHEQPALVERYIPGREIHVAILGNSPPVVLPLLEFEFEETDDGGPQILTYEAKWDPTSPDFYATDVQVPARRMPKRLGAKIERIALAAYAITGCRDYARVDMRIDEDGNPFVLEVNPNPDLADDVGFMLCAQKSGRSFQRTVVELVEMALTRGPSRLRPRRRTGGRAGWPRARTAG
jgi:D-alanine-D-alanine ligase